MARNSKINATDFCNSILQCGLPPTPLMLWDVELPSLPKPPVNKIVFKRPEVTSFKILI